MDRSSLLRSELLAVLHKFGFPSTQDTRHNVELLIDELESRQAMDELVQTYADREDD